MLSQRRLTKRFLVLSVVLGLIGAILLASISQAQPPDPPPPLQDSLDPFNPPDVPSPAPISAQGASKTFPVVADAEVRQGNPDTRYGIEPFMAAGYDQTTAEMRLIQRSLLHFDISAVLPPRTIIHQATLQLYMAGYCDTGPSSYRVHRVSADWSEFTVTWASQPAFAEGYGANNIPLGSDAFDWYSFDVTNLAQSWVNGTVPEYGLMLRGPEAANQCAYRQFLTKGGGGFTTAPRLIVNYTLPPPAITLSGQHLDFYYPCETGGPNPGPQQVMFKTNRNILTDWTATIVGGSWLNLSKSHGKISSIFPDDIEVTIEAAAGCNDGSPVEIQISAPSLGGNPQTVTATFHQSQSPTYFVYLPMIIKPGLNDSLTLATPAEKIALLIGVADYQYLEPPAAFTVLRGGVWGDDILAPRGDQFAMRQFFKDDTACDLSTLEGQLHSQAACSIRTISLSEQQATRANVEYALEWIDEREDANTELFIYFSGHGGPFSDQPPLDESDNKDELLGVYDTNDTPEFVDYIGDDSFESLLANLETEHLAVVIDACNSGGMEVSNPYRAVLAASQEEQNSWESSELEHGVFTYYMLEAINNPSCDVNQDDWISVKEVYDCARTPVKNYVQSNQGVAQDLHLDLSRDVKLVPLSPTVTGR